MKELVLELSRSCYLGSGSEEQRLIMAWARKLLIVLQVIHFAVTFSDSGRRKSELFSVTTFNVYRSHCSYLEIQFKLVNEQKLPQMITSAPCRTSSWRMRGSAILRLGCRACIQYLTVGYMNPLGQQKPLHTAVQLISTMNAGHKSKNKFRMLQSRFRAASRHIRITCSKFKVIETWDSLQPI